MAVGCTRLYKAEKMPLPQRLLRGRVAELQMELVFVRRREEAIVMALLAEEEARVRRRAARQRRPRRWWVRPLLQQRNMGEGMHNRLLEGAVMMRSREDFKGFFRYI